MVWLKRDSVTAGRGLPPPPLAAPATGGVMEKLRKLIGEGRFPPESKLPPERALAMQLGVGRPALREAIKGLGVLGVLESRRGAGTFVKSREAAARPPGPADAAEEFGVLDLLEVRKILEPRAAWLAATRAGERDLLEIEAARHDLERHDGDWRLVARLDAALHAAIIRGARNPVLDLINGFLMTHILLRRNPARRFTPDAERMRRDHKAIVDAILKRQADRAEQAMIEHLNAIGLEFLNQPRMNGNERE